MLGSPRVLGGLVTNFAHQIPTNPTNPIEGPFGFPDSFGILRLDLGALRLVKDHQLSPENLPIKQFCCTLDWQGQASFSCFRDLLEDLQVWVTISTIHAPKLDCSVSGLH